MLLCLNFMVRTRSRDQGLIKIARRTSVISVYKVRTR